MKHRCPFPTLVLIVAALLSVSAATAADAPHEPCVAPTGTAFIEFQSDNNVLRGFIDLPRGAGKHPAIMIVHGGADTDVTSASPYWDELRRALTRAGIATVMWDKAGQGCSSGKYVSRFPVRERANEVLAALELLKRRDDIDTTRIGAWGLSQGGWVAPMAAVRSSGIAYLIIVSGPGRDALSQNAYLSIDMLRKAGASQAEAEGAYAALRRGLAMARAGASTQELLADARGLQKYPVLRQTFGLDIEHAEEVLTLLKSPEWSIGADVFLEQLRQPTLAIFGERDAVVDWRDSIDVYRTSFARSGNRDLTLETFPQADHEMLATAGSPTPLTYVPGYIDAMIEWLAARKFTAPSDD